MVFTITPNFFLLIQTYLKLMFDLTLCAAGY